MFGLGKKRVRQRSIPEPEIFRSSHRPAARAAAVFLSVCMTFTTMPAPVYAAAPNREAETGLCEHHPEHTAECGYREAEPGHPCGHGHTADCHTDELICGLIEDEDVTASDSDAGHKHTQDCYALDCPHERGEHTEECGYTEGVEGVPCGYLCTECGKPGEGGGNGNTTGGNLTGGNNLPVPGENNPELVQPNGKEDKTVTSFDKLDETVKNQTVQAGTALEKLVLPETLSATVQTGDENPEPVEMKGVVWEPDVLYEGAAGTYAFTASAAGYILSQGVDWPVITITVEEGKPTQEEIDALCAAIDALPTVDEIYENAPGDADPEFDAWVSETKTKLAEVPALWAQLSALSEDTAVMERITEARAEKLAGLNNLMEKLAERKTLEGTHTHAMSVDCSTTEGEQVTFDQVLTSENNKPYINGTEVELDSETHFYCLPPGNYYLTADVELDKSLCVKRASHVVNLCLNGYKLTNGGNTGIVINSGTLNLCDCNGSGGSHTITSPVTNEEVTISGGLITGANKPGIRNIVGCTFNLYGGTIAGNGDPETQGGGVQFTNSGYFIMYGGSILHNRGAYGGGVYARGGVSLNGGEIKSNWAQSAGGGVYADDSCSVYFSGSPVISGNVAGEERIVSNLGLRYRPSVRIGDDFAPTTPIGITTEQVPTKDSPVNITGENSKDYSNCFKSDNDAYVIQNGADNVVQLVPVAPTATICGGTCGDLHANGVPLLLVAGSGSTGSIVNTVVYIDKNGNGQLDNGVDEIFDPDGDGTDYDGTAVGNNLYDWDIYGGSKDTGINGDTKITMLGGSVYRLFGGGFDASATVTGNTHVTVTGGNVDAVTGGGYDAAAAVTGSKTVTVGGAAEIGFFNNSNSGPGIIISGGTEPSVSNGVDTFAIAPAFTGENKSVRVTLPEGYDASASPTVATGAVDADLAKITLSGKGAIGKEAYLEGGNIKVREKAYVSTPTVDRTTLFTKLYANGIPLLLVKGRNEEGGIVRTVIYIDVDRSGTVTGSDIIFDPSGDGATMDATAAGNDLTSWIIYGGSQKGRFTGDTKITMRGGSVGLICGGGANDLITGNTSVTMADGVAGVIYGGGFGNSLEPSEVSGIASVTMTGGTVGTVYGGGSNANAGGASVSVTGGTVDMIYGGGSGGTVGSRSLTVGGGVKVNLKNSTGIPVLEDYTGIVINGGSPEAEADGVESFTIDPDLTESATVNVRLPEGYDVSGEPTIATGATADDLAKFKLSGDGAANVEAWLDGDAIKVRIPAPKWYTDTIYANGAPLILDKGTTEGNTVIYIDTDRNGKISDSDPILSFNVTGVDNATEAGNDLKNYTVYGGSGWGDDYTGDTSLIMLGGQVSALYGGGNGQNTGGKVTGNTSVTVKGGTVGGVHGGGDLSNGTNVDGNTSVVIEGGTVTSRVLGGGNGSGVITGDATLTIKGGTVLSGGMTSMVCGGGNGEVKGTASVNISGGTVNALVFGGGQYDGPAASSQVNITGGEITGALYGGGLEAGTTGAASVSMTGGELVEIPGDDYYNGCIYGGNMRSAAGSQSVILGGSAQMDGGVVFERSGYLNGVSTVNIESGLTGTNPISFILPAGFDASENPVIATGAAEADLAKIMLTGAGSKWLEAYREGTDIKVRLPYTVSVSVREQGPYYKNDEIFLTADARDAGDQTEMTAGSVQFYLEDTPLGSPVSYNPTEDFGKPKGFALGVICGTSSFIPAITAGSDNNIKAVYTSDNGTKVTAKPITVRVSEKINGSRYISSATFANLTGDGEHDVTSVQFSVANSGGEQGIKASDFVITGTRDGVTLLPAEFRIDVGDSDETASVRVREPGTYVFTAKFPESSSYTGTEVSDSVVVLAPYTVTYALNNLTAEGQPTRVNYGDAFSAVLTAERGWKLPESVTVSMGGSPLTQDPENGYTYSQATGTVGIAHATGNVVITATGVKLSEEKQMTAFTVPNQAGDTVIDQTNHTVTVTVPHGTDVTGLPPVITVSDKAGVSPVSGAAQNFTSPVTYTVTAEDGTTQIYTVTVKVQTPSITTHTITASAGSGGTISPSGTVAVNEGESQTFTVTPDSKYKISRVTVDGADKGAVAAYTFEHVTADHRISVTFTYIGGGSTTGGGGGGGSSSGGGGSSSVTSTTTGTTAGENGTSTTTTQTTSKDSSGKTTTVTTDVTKDAAGNVTGSATTVTTDNITASTDQGGSTVTVKPDAAAIGSAAAAVGATAASPMDITVAVPQDSVRSELQKVDVNAVRIEVILPKSVEDNPAVRTAGVTIEKETVDAARQTGKNVAVTVRQDTGTINAVWSLDGQTMRNAAGQSTDLNLGVHTAPVQSNDPIATPVKPPVTAAGRENGLVISITADGTLLSGAKLTVPATDRTAITAGSTVILYRFDQNTGALSAVPGGGYTVDANGNVTIDVPAGTRTGAKETYVLLPDGMAAAPQAPAGGAGIPAANAEGGTVHTVKAGDTLNQISAQYGCRVEDLLALNPGVDIYNLQIGSDLRVR